MPGKPNTSRRADSIVCIGKGVHLSWMNLRIVADLFISSDGCVSAAVHSSNCDAASIAKFISSMGYAGLNLIASDYFYKTEGQASTIIDIMAGHGHISFSEAGSFSKAVEASASAPVILFVGGSANG